MVKNVSLWMATGGDSSYPPLDKDTTADVCIIGGGIAGILAAYQIAERGFQVAVVEANRVCAGVTGYTTAKVTSAHSLIYSKLMDTAGPKSAQAYADANQWGVQWVAGVAESLKIDCDLSRRAMLLYGETEDERNQLQAELDACRNVGLPVNWTDEVALPIKTVGAVRYEDQVQFHPRKFVLGLAEKLANFGGKIYEQTRALEVKEGEPCEVVTDHGTIRSRWIVVASHFPIYDPAMYLARLAQYRDYAVAAQVRGPLAEDMSIGVSEQAMSFRTQPYHDGELLVVSGETHKTGQEPDTRKRYESLENYVREHFDVIDIPYRWSTQDNSTPDSMPYIGRISPRAKYCLVTTGYNAWGMSTAAFSGSILADLISGRENEWADAFDPNRFKGFESLKATVKENVNAVKHLVGDKFSDAEKMRPEDLQPGQGAILKVEDDKVAVCRDSQGQIHAVSPICTHIGCDIAWNPAEESWDCPCHGSRFSMDGHVIQGPAVKDLAPKMIKIEANDARVSLE